jgi:hypothetical protein
VLVQDLGVEADHFLGREGVEIAADRIDRARNIFGGPVLSPLEEHVLDEVRNAILLGALPAGTAGNPDPDRHRTHVGHRFRNDFNSIA